MICNMQFNQESVSDIDGKIIIIIITIIMLIIIIILVTLHK